MPEPGLRVFLIAEMDPLMNEPQAIRLLEGGWLCGIGVVSLFARQGNPFYKAAHMALRLLIAFRFRDYLKLLSAAARRLLGIEPEFRTLARELGVPVYRIDRVNAARTLGILRESRCDVLFHQTNQILKKEVLEIPRYGVLNKHLGRLPEYRGCFTPFWAYLNGETEFSATIHWVDEAIDTGRIANQGSLKARRGESLAAIIHRQNRLAQELLLETFQDLNQGRIRRQAHEGVSGYHGMPGLLRMLRYFPARISRLFSSP